jgi:hypothetical protein
MRQSNPNVAPVYDCDEAARYIAARTGEALEVA